MVILRGVVLSEISPPVKQDEGKQEDRSNTADFRGHFLQAGADLVRTRPHATPVGSLDALGFGARQEQTPDGGSGVLPQISADSSWAPVALFILKL